MIQKIIIAFLFGAVTATAHSQIVPKGYSATHSDSCWHFTFDYDTPKPASGEGMLIVTHLCTPDTCISTTEKHIQGKRYARRYVKRYGSQPPLHSHGPSSSSFILPETAISDTVYGIVYCEYSDRNVTKFLCDTTLICMPECPPMSCHRLEPQKSFADHLADEHRHVQNIRYYTALDNNNAAEKKITPHLVRYTSNSNKLNPGYLQNAQSIEEFMDMIDNILADSTTTIEAIQIAGYTLPDGSEDKATQRGLKRAASFRDHIRRHCDLPDSIFEIAGGGGKNWNIIYSDIMEMGLPYSSELVEELQSEPDAVERERILKRYKGGEVYRILQERYFPAHRMACCTGIYYSNAHDTTTNRLNAIVDELINNPSPDYGKLIAELKHYRQDPRVLNLEGIIEYRRHHRHAAEKAFRKAAEMGDEQALLNLEIVENNKKE